MELIAVQGYMGNGTCPVHICKAVCCRSNNFRPDRPPPCEYLTERSTCELHEVGGPKCKPVGCWEFPRNQADIDQINREAEKAGFKERCQLSIG